MHIARDPAAMPEFDVISDGTRPAGGDVRAEPERHEVRRRTTSPASSASAAGWCPAYTMPPKREDLAVLRVVVRNGFSHDMAELFLRDLRSGDRLARRPRRRRCRTRSSPAASTTEAVPQSLRYAERPCGQRYSRRVGLSVVAARLFSWRGPASRRTRRRCSPSRRCCAGCWPVAPGRVGRAGAGVRRAGRAEEAVRRGSGRGAGPGADPRGRAGLGCGVVDRVGPVSGGRPTGPVARLRW